MDNNDTLKANSLSAGKEIYCLLWNPKFFYRFHKIPQLDSILNQTKPVHSIQTLFLYVPGRTFRFFKPICTCKSRNFNFQYSSAP